MNQDELHLTAVTSAPGQTLNIEAVRFSSPGIINWGDNSVTFVAAKTGAQDYTELNHVYASAGTYTIGISPASKMTLIRITDAKLSGLDTAELANATMAYFSVAGVPGCRIHSEDMVGWQLGDLWLENLSSGDIVMDTAHWTNWHFTSGWRNLFMFNISVGSWTIKSSQMTHLNPGVLRFYTMSGAGPYDINLNSSHLSGWTFLRQFSIYGTPAGTYVINSSDFTAKSALTYFRVYNLSSGTFTIDTADFAALTGMQYFQVYSLPSGTYTMAANCIRNWKGIRTVSMYSLVPALTQAQVDAIVDDVYAGRLTFTYAAPVLQIGGTNAAASGVYQLMCPPTTPKERIYQLKNDGCGEGIKKWSVTYN